MTTRTRESGVDIKIEHEIFAFYDGQESGEVSNGARGRASVKDTVFCSLKYIMHYT